MIISIALGIIIAVFSLALLNFLMDLILP